jgi:hypothetical protein
MEESPTTYCVSENAHTHGEHPGPCVTRPPEPFRVTTPHAVAHVEFLTDYCGAHCTGDWHCVTCHRNNELREQHEVVVFVREMKSLVEGVTANPMFAQMAQTMGMGLSLEPQKRTIRGFGNGRTS